MSDNYTFRYLNTDGSLNGVTFMDCKDQRAAQRDALRLMPKRAESVEIWKGDNLDSVLGSLSPEHSNRTNDFLDRKATPPLPAG
jgi:hypothetical protein